MTEVPRIMVPPLLDQEPKARRRGQWFALIGLAVVIIAIVILLFFR